MRAALSDVAALVRAAFRSTPCKTAGTLFRASAEWCLNAVNQCWTQKAPRIAPSELAEARKAYDHARDVYRQLILESER